MKGEWTLLRLEMRAARESRREMLHTRRAKANYKGTERTGPEGAGQEALVVKLQEAGSLGSLEPRRGKQAARAGLS